MIGGAVDVGIVTITSLFYIFYTWFMVLNSVYISPFSFKGLKWRSVVVTKIFYHLVRVLQTMSGV